MAPQDGLTVEQRAVQLLDLIDPWVPRYAWKQAEQSRKIKLALIENTIKEAVRDALDEVNT